MKANARRVVELKAVMYLATWFKSLVDIARCRVESGPRELWIYAACIQVK